MERNALAALAGALLLATVHLFAGKLRFLDVIPRSRWLSFGSGLSVAYVFLHLLPELAEIAEAGSRALGLRIRYIEHPVFAIAAIGLASFYGLERLAEESRERHRESEGHDHTSPGVFWLHIGSFGVYNALIGYVLVDKTSDLLAFALFLTAMALHFVVNDYGLRQHHKELYHRSGRWTLAVAVLLGWLSGTIFSVPERWRLVLLAFIAGGVILNVLKEELPAERESRFGSFALGLVLYSALLMAL